MKRRLVPSDHVKKLPRFFAYVAIARHDRTMIRVKERHAVERVPAFIPRGALSFPSNEGVKNEPILLTPLHRRYVKIHTGMKQRCTNPNDVNYKDYGGRGIKYAPEFEQYEFFERWVDDNLGERPGDNWTLDREENDKGYEPGNLRWASKATQARNRRVRVLAASGRSRSP